MNKSPITKRHIAALYAACGWKVTHIMRELNISNTLWYRWQKDPTFKLEIERYKEELTNRMIEAKVNLEFLFDSEAYNAYLTLRDLHRNAEMETVRLGAAKDILDRAPNAPKQKQHHVEDHRWQIILGGQTFENLRETLEEIDEGEIIDLLPEETSQPQPTDSLPVTNLEELFD